MAQPDEPIALVDMMFRRASRREQIWAAVFVGIFVLFTVESTRYGALQGPTVRPFIPICATLWCVADLLTAFLLFTQFSVNGVRAFAYIGGAYAVSGALTIPYIVFFPGLFIDASVGMGTEQISAWLWLGWHIVFPVIIAGYRLYDSTFTRRYISGLEIRAGLRGALTCVAGGSAVAIGAAITWKDLLPPIVVQGHFTPLWSHVLAPVVFGVNAVAALLVIGFGRRPSLLQVWLAVALATSALDGLLNAWATGRYTGSWYLGKAETLTTAAVLLLMLLSQVGALYRRLGTMAIIDSLTGLRNRRSFDEYLRWTLDRRAKAEIAYLLLDVDYFKQFNDTYGHAAGDVCLRRIADTLKASLWRSADLVARYGGEEFVILLPDTTAEGAFEVAERIRLAVMALAIPHKGSAVAKVVTLSIGVAHASRSSTSNVHALFEFADRALYAAKIHRNETVLSHTIVEAAPVGQELRVVR